MYLRHFGLREMPFAITPDTSFFYPHEGAQAALNTLVVALRSGEGFLKVVGEVGCGKTVLCRQLLNVLGDEYRMAYIPNPDMGPHDLLLALAQELSLPISPSAGRHQILTQITQGLLAQAQSGRRVIVCIDEAQAIPVRTVESLRLLSNLETEKRKLLQIVLLGQPELDVKLARTEIRQLLQRITFSEYLGPMEQSRVPDYLRHRLGLAAIDHNTDTQVFEAEAARAIASASRGVPRLVNVLAHKCLLLAYGENQHRVNGAHVRLAVQDTPSLRPGPGKPWAWRQWLARLSAGRTNHGGGQRSAPEREGDQL